MIHSLPDATALIVIVVPFWALFFLSVQFVLRRVIHYRLTDTGFEVVALGVMVLSRVRCEDVTAMEVMSFGRLVWLSLYTRLFWAVRAGNRLVTRRVVVVTRRQGAGRALIITPDDPDLFVVAMQERCPSSAPSMAAR